jgi:hypothetical protein
MSQRDLTYLHGVMPHNTAIFNTLVVETDSSKTHNIKAHLNAWFWVSWIHTVSSQPISLRSIFILSFCLVFVLPRFSFPGSPPKTVYAFNDCDIQATCPVHRKLPIVLEDLFMNYRHWYNKGHLERSTAGKMHQKGPQTVVRRCPIRLFWSR